MKSVPKSVRGFDGRFIPKGRNPKKYKLLGYAHKGYKDSIKKVLRSMNLKEIVELFKAMDSLSKITENVLNDFEHEFLTWEGSIFEDDPKATIKKADVFRDLKELMKEV